MNMHCLEQDILKIFNATANDKTTQKGLGCSQNTKRDATNDAGFENVHLNAFRRRTCLLMRKLAWLGNRNKWSFLLFNELLAMDTACLKSASTLLCSCLHNTPKMGKFIRHFKSHFPKQSPLYIFRSCSLHGMISLFKQA